MSEIETNADSAEAVLPIETICIGECPSLSGRSTLSFAIGRHTEEGTLFLAVTSNSGKGMFCKDWASASAIQDIVLGEDKLTAKSFHGLHPGRSINTGGFVQAALKELGLIRANDENTRVLKHVPQTTFEKVVSAYISQAKAAKPEAAGRKTLRLKPKEG